MFKDKEELNYLKRRLKENLKNYLNNNSYLSLITNKLLA